ncbi:MAG: hypothetical protein JNL38_16490 [Myxococcales bacterium]|nr:hypothetical protein [Myxococcales bacterium]
MLTLVFGLPCLALVAYVIIRMELAERRDYVIFDNATAGPVVVHVDGHQVATLGTSAAERSRLVELEPGAHAVRVEGSGASGGAVQPLEESAITVPARGRFEKGMRAIYPVGRARYALVTAVYVASGEDVPDKDSRRPLEPQGKLVVLPKEVSRIYLDAIDKPFSRTESIPKGSKSVSITHVCRVRSARSVGCPGAPEVED